MSNTKIELKFLDSVLWDGGHYCLFVANPSTKKKFQKFYDSTSDLLSAAKKYDHGGSDTYYAMGTIIEPGTRSADNIGHLRSFFLDLDCGEDKAKEGKGYPTQTAALQELKNFCRSHQLPKPVLVSSGNGIHAYWPLDEGVERDEWLPLAMKFKQMALAANLRIDPVVTADAARVLRVPGTYNHKSGGHREVSILGEWIASYPLALIEAVLDTYAEEPPKPMPVGAQRFVNDPLTSAMLGNVSSEFKIILEKSQNGTGCAQILHAAQNQDTLEEPLWRAALSIASQCADRDKAIHIISKDHPDYDPDETERKANQTKGPYHCTSFSEIDPSLCENCPNRGKITSPIQLGRKVMKATEEDNIIYDRPEKVAVAGLQQYVIPTYPSPYFRGKNGGVYLESENKAGEPIDICVYHHDLYVVSRITDPELGDGVIMRLHLPFDGVREFDVPLTAVTSKEEFRKYLSKHGVATSRVENLMDYAIKWINKLEYTAAADSARRQFGWTDKELTCFALGRTLVYQDRFETNPPSKTTAPLFDMFEPRGSLDKWKELMRFYNRPGLEAYQYTVGLGFGSVLMAMTPINGTVFHLHSKISGAGKTTAMYAAASAWADPKRYVLQAEDTQNSKMMRAETLRDLPLFFDELTNIDPKTASDMLYQIPAGMQKNRMARDGNTERYRGEPWRLICVTTANTSLIARVSMYKEGPKAELQRVLESPQKKYMFETKEETDQFSDSLSQNYGHAGTIFLQHVMRNTESVRTMLKKVQRELDIHAGLEAENRFWSVQAACGITALMICKKIGLLNYDINTIAKWAVETMQAAKSADAILSDDCLQLVTEYIYDNYDKFLRLSSRGAESGEHLLDHLVVPTAVPRMQLVGRHETDKNRWYLLPKPLRNWCINKQIDYSWLVGELKNSSAKAMTTKFRMGRGTKVNLPPVTALVLNGDGWMSQEVLDGFEGHKEAETSIFE